MHSVLLVDDSPSDRALFRTILGRSGYRVHELARGRDVPAALKELCPQAIVLDVNLPDMNGHQVCRNLRAEPDSAGIPVLMLTVRDRVDDVLAGLEAGADDYVAKDEGAEIILARLRRLIRYRQMASTLSLNEQLAQVGRLLAGIVHEIRGPLSVIRGHAELLKLQSDSNDRIDEQVGPILRNVKLLQLRLEHLMAAVRGGPPVLQPISIPATVREARELFLSGSSPNRPKLSIEAEYEPGCPPALADEGRLILVLLNLFTNADDAIQSLGIPGELRIRGSREESQGRGWLRLDVFDNGPGIPQGQLERIFEPFFTTKPSGSGFGLYLVSELIREQNGRIDVCNGPDGGACFTIWLPEAPARAVDAEEG